MNEFLFLGTGAADWEIEKRDGFFRRNSAALINKELMVDCGSHIFDFAESIDMKDLYDGVTDIVITHSHDDHLCRASVLKIAENHKIRVGCDGGVMRIIGTHPNIEYVPFIPYEAKNMGSCEIIPLLANHQFVTDGTSHAFHYIIKTGDGKEIFYGLDGAWFLRPSWEEMKKHRFDLMVFDCTVGDSSDRRLFEHNTVPMLRMIIEAVKSENLSAENGIMAASHLARTLHAPNEETKNILSEIGLITAYDGLKLKF